MLLRVASALVQKLPKDSNLLIETLSTQLARLPVEVRRVVKGAAAAFLAVGKNDEEFYKKYEEALRNLPEEDVATVVRLQPHQLKEWVCSPARARPQLIDKWAEQDAKRGQEAQRVREGLKQFLKGADKAFGKLNDRLERLPGAKR